MSNRTLDKKLSYWKQQLLDFSKRNRMINFRDSNLSTLKIVEPEYINLYNRIVEKRNKETTGICYSYIAIDTST